MGNYNKREAYGIITKFEKSFHEYDADSMQETLKNTIIIPWF